MKIQFNTDKNISGNEEKIASFTSLLSDELRRFNGQITRLEAHLADENGQKKGPGDKRCLLEARLEGMKPIAVTNHADTDILAVQGAADKLKASLSSILGRRKNY